ncbi:hypothetical protein Tsubulata_046215 [Turnera subulata]|uniref:Uncharacterized protein n=1 Tax=Turnera subulata TaxID=218843 RepID=A0A9Q0J785_9ROSI|nr:hypothetical protein Tsubulata_046215 [Turnera subulata]
MCAARFQAVTTLQLERCYVNRDLDFTDSYFPNLVNLHLHNVDVGSHAVITILGSKLVYFKMEWNWELSGPVILCTPNLQYFKNSETDSDGLNSFLGIDLPPLQCAEVLVGSSDKQEQGDALLELLDELPM